MSATASPRSSRSSGNIRGHRDDSERILLRDSRNTGVTNSTSDSQSPFNVSIHSFYFAPSTLYGLRSPNIDGSKGYTVAEHAVLRSLDPFLFRPTHAEKLCVAANHPEIFSNAAYLELVYGSTDGDGERGTIARGKSQSHPQRMKQNSLKRVGNNEHPLGQSQRTDLGTLHFTSATAVPQARVAANRRKKGVLPNEALYIRPGGSKEVDSINASVEAFEMGNPRSPLQQALFIAQTTGYGGHERVETGLEAQPSSMQFTKLTGDLYEKVNLTHEWFRNCCEYTRSIEIAFPSAVEGWLWESAVQRQCNEYYYFYIHQHCSYGTLLPPRLDLRPVQMCPRSIRFEQYLVPRHEYKVEKNDAADDLDLIPIRGPYECGSTSLRKQSRLGRYRHVGDPHQHVLFRPRQDNSNLERWRTRNLTEDGTLFRYSRRNSGPSLVQYDDIDHVSLFQNNRCRRYFPRLRPNVYPRRR